MTGPSGVSCGTIFILETSHLIILLIECYRHMMHDEWVHHWSQTLKTDTSIWTFVVQTCLDSFISEPVEIPVNEVHEIIKGPSFPVSSIEDFILYPSEESFTCWVVRGPSLFWHWSGKTSAVHPGYPSLPPVVSTSVRVDNRLLPGLQCLYSLVKHCVCKLELVSRVME